MFLREKERMRLETLQQKNSYISGQWNVNTVLMGGLGKDPDNEGKKCIYESFKIHFLVDVELQEQPHTKDIQVGITQFILLLKFVFISFSLRQNLKEYGNVY